MTAPRPGGCAIHVAVWVPYEQAEARIAAAGSEADIATTKGSD